MKNSKIRIGIIGVDPTRGWASYAHIPAIKQFTEFEITAVTNPSMDKAVAASKLFGIPNAFDNVDDLLASSEVDLVVVAVKVPYHKELVEKVIKSGKHVYCEWPLGNGLEEARVMTKWASDKNVTTFAGLQSQSVPAIRYIKKLIAEGYVGKVLSTSVVASGGMLMTDTSNAYTLDVKNGASMLTIPFGASIHALCNCLGAFSEITATTATVNQFGEIAESGEKVPITIEDQIAVSGTLVSGAVASIHYRAGVSKGTNFLWEINGTEGDLVITADFGHIAFFPLTIKGAKKNQTNVEILEVPKDFLLVPGSLDLPVYNLAQNYALVLKDLIGGTKQAPRFEDALATHHLLDAIQKASTTGQRQIING